MDNAVFLGTMTDRYDKRAHDQFEPALFDDSLFFMFDFILKESPSFDVRSLQRFNIRLVKEVNSGELTFDLYAQFQNESEYAEWALENE